MGQPVKVSTELLADARATGHVLNRSAAGQIEFWAEIGRAVEPLLAGNEVIALRRAGRVRPLSGLLATVETEAGRRRLHAVLRGGPGPRYEAAASRPGLLVRTDVHGRRTTGRFVGREFKPSR